jgi:hypothetical protein
MKMSEQQINAAIAEACGKVWKSDNVVLYRVDDEYSQNPPDYCNDLNLMHEAEKILTDEDYFNYCRHFLPDAQNAVISQGRTATARQRAEAFLRTLGKWEE